MKQVLSDRVTYGVFVFAVVLSICDSFFNVCDVEYTHNYCVLDFEWTTSV